MGSATGPHRRVVLRRYPTGALQPSDFEVEAYEPPPLGEGQFLVRNLYVSVDPMLRIWVDPAPLGGSFSPLPLGSLIAGAAVGEVVESRHPAFAVGELVEGRFGWQHLDVSDGAGVHRVGPAVRPIENALGVYGLPGFTAFVGLHRLGGVKPGQTVVVSGAAGAVGSMVGPLVRAAGGRAVGIASGQAKRAYLQSIGYEAMADRTAPDFLDQLKQALPNGADIYFDNVGGSLMATVAPLMARGGRILICGLMAQYQPAGDASVDHLPAVLHAVMGRGVTIEAFSQVGQEALRPEFERQMGELIRTGQLKPEMHVEEGLERLPAALCGLFDNSRTGKVVVRVAAETTAGRAHADSEETI